MAKHYDNGAAKKAAKRTRPALTSRVIHPAQSDAERARAAQDRTRTIPGALTQDDVAAAQSGSQKKARRRRVPK